MDLLRRCSPLAAALLVACAAEGEAPSAPSSAAPDAVTLGAPFALGDLVRRVHFAFRPTAEGWVARHATYAVRGLDGALLVAPTLSPRAGAPPVRGAVGRFRTEAPGGPAVEGLDADGALTLTRPEATERWRNTDAGVEQSWSFARRPTGAELTVRVSVEGLAYRGATALGLHFVDPATGLGLRYGRATWIDADGRRTAVPARWDGAAIVLSVDAATLASARFPAVLDPVIGPEAGVDGVPSYAEDFFVARPRIAFNGTSYLAVWSDVGLEEGSDIVGARISAAGALLDPGGIGIRLSADTVEVTPDVASDGHDFLVTWQQGSSAGAFRYAAARVGGDGAVLDANPIELGPGANFVTLGEDPIAPAVAWSGPDYFVGWANADRFNATVCRVRSTGALRDCRAVLAASAAGAVSRVALAATPSTVVAAWEQLAGAASDIRFARLGVDGVVLDPAGRAATVAAFDRALPALTSDGTNVLLAWNARTGSGARAPGIYGVVLAPDASSVGPSVTYFGPSAGPTGTTHARPALAFDGASYLAAWAHTASGGSDTLYGARVSRAGALVDATPRALATPAHAAAVTYLAAGGGSGGAEVVWQDGNAMAGVHVGSDGAPTAARVQATASDAQGEADVAADGAGFLAVWIERSATSATFAARIDAAGRVLDPTPLALGAPGASWPSVAFNGADYLATWVGAAGASFSARVRPAGGLVGAPIATARAGRPLVASRGAVLGPVNTQARTNYTLIPVRRLRADGTALDPDVITAGRVADSTTAVTVGTDGTGFLVAWADALHAHYFLGAARINADGDVLDVPALRVNLAEDFNVGALALAYDGAQYLLAWQDERTAARTGSIYATRVRPDGTVVDAAPVRLSEGARAGANAGVAAAWDGRSFVVAWCDTQRGNGDILGARVSSTGAALDPTPLVLAADPLRPETEARLAANPDGRSLLLYRRVDATTVSRRVFARVVVFGSDAGVIDASTVDVGTVDVGAVDVGTIDVGAVDVGAVDVGAVDAGAVDVGAVDAGVLDAVVDRPIANDRGQPDVGASADAGVVESGPDASADASVTPADEGGGGLCSVRGGAGAATRGGSAAAMSLAMLALLRRRRRVAPA